MERTKNIPQYSAVFYQMGLDCTGKCGPEEQLQYFQKAVRYSPESKDASYNSQMSDAHYRLAQLYEEKGDFVHSLESFVKAAEFDQNNSFAFYRIGLHYFREGANEQALRYFLQSDRRRSRPHEVYYYLARIYDQMKKYDLAIQHYNDIISVRSEYLDRVCPRLAELYYFLDDEKALLFRTYTYRQYGQNDLADRLEESFRAVQVSQISKEEISGRLLKE